VDLPEVDRSDATPKNAAPKKDSLELPFGMNELTAPPANPPANPSTNQPPANKKSTEESITTPPASKNRVQPDAIPPGKDRIALPDSPKSNGVGSTLPDFFNDPPPPIDQKTGKGASTQPKTGPSGPPNSTKKQPDDKPIWDDVTLPPPAPLK
jgi:hypothetical protein